MKRVYKNLIFLSLSLLVCMFLAIPANAQHRGHGGGGGRSGGGGGRSFSGGGHATFSAGRSSGSRTAFSAGRSSSRTFSAPRGNVRGRTAYSVGARGRTAYSRGGVGVRGRAYVGGRGYARGGYRGGYGRGYRGYGYRGRFGYGGFYNHGGFYRSLYYPRLGFSVGFLPYGYYPFYWGGLQYYYSNGYYYNYDNDQYTVVEPPVGAEISTLPANAQSIVINGQQYYELDGIYYVAVTKDDGSLAYEIAGKDGELNTDGGGDDQQGPPVGNDQGNYAPDNSSSAPMQAPEPQPRVERNGSADLQIGDVVQSLPKDSRGVTVNGQRLFVSPDDVYYKQTRDKDNQVAYKIVGLPSEEPDNN